jgi:hypothetical protein
MVMAMYITKASGEQELFDIEKFRRSLHRAGAPDSLVDQIAHEIEQQEDLRTTKEIYRFALGYLKQETPGLAARYATKRALLDFGPAGFPFEKFIAELFKAQGYGVMLDQIRKGFCVEHELDVIAFRDNTHLLVECKFHNRQQLKTDLKVVLAVKSRVDDLKKAIEVQGNGDKSIHEAWIVTNTKFTFQAIQYAECAGIFLLGWGYPLENSLPQLIDRYGLHPVTALTNINYRQKAELIRRGCVLCRDVRNHEETLQQMGLGEQRIARIMREAQEVYKRNNHNHQSSIIK